MQRVNKFEEEPPLLKAYKEAFPNWDKDVAAYDKFRATDNQKMQEGDALLPFQGAFTALRVNLMEEAKFACVYCGQLLSDDVLLMKTEHFEPQEVLDKQLDYTNLLACCLGNQKPDEEAKRKNPKPELHCDSAKGNRRLMALPNPASIPARDARITYSVIPDILDMQADTIEGNVKIHHPDKQLFEELTGKDKLNLNETYLCQKRYGRFVIEVAEKLGLDQTLWTEANVRTLRDEYAATPDNRHREFKDFILWYLDEWLRKFAAPTAR